MRLATAARTADRFVAAGPECDFVPLVAAPYPLHVVMQILGVPEEDEPKMLFLTQQMFGGQDEDLSKSGMADMTPDFAPIMGRTPVEGFYLDAGWGTWGFKATPYVTRVSDYIDAVQWNAATNLPATTLVVDKFSVLKYVNQSARIYGLDLSGRLPLAQVLQPAARRVAATKSSRTRSMSARVMARGIGPWSR